jgi:choline dehydrogenase-like flavoprotein
MSRQGGLRIERMCLLAQVSRAGFYRSLQEAQPVEAVQLSRKIGRTAPFSDVIDHEMAPGSAVDDGEALRANLVATVDAVLHPTSTVPMGADSDPTAVVNAWGKVRGVEALRVVDTSILPDIPSVPTTVTTIMVAERIAAKLSRA